MECWEIGLAKQFTPETFNKQIIFFKTFLKIARERDLIVNLHATDAWKQVFELTLKHDTDKAVFHWYNGPVNLLHEIESGSKFRELMKSFKASLNPTEPLTNRGRLNRFLGFIREMNLNSFLETKQQTFFNFIKSLIEEYREKAGVKVNPRISVNNKWKRKTAHVKYHLFDKTGVVGTPELTINLKMLEEYFKADRELGEKIIRFVIAHEVGHLKQREKYGFNLIGYPDVLVEMRRIGQLRNLQV